MSGHSRSRNACGVFALTSAWSLLAASEAQAHVKWFCGYDVAQQPRGLNSVFGEQLWLLSGLAIGLLVAGCVLEGTGIGKALLRALDRVTAGARANTDGIVRIICAFFFTALWGMGGVLLTPELKTASTIIPWVQLGIAACLMFRRTLPLAALGIVILYTLSEVNYGVFHLMDYPIFLGIAAYLAVVGLELELPGAARPVDLLRWAAGITLIWASVEKWAYPDWSFPLLTMYPEMTLGFDRELYMRAAGVIEFALAFGLLWTPLVRRVSAIMLGGMFISAIFEFGAIDAVGHSAIIAVMVAVACDDARVQWRPRQAVLLPLAYAVALIAVLIPYYGGHAVLFGTAIM